MSVGLDKHIDDAVTKFTNKLWTTYDNLIVGRSFNIPNKENQNSPHYYLGSNEYKEIFVDDNYDSIVHFHVESNRPNNATSTYKAEVYIMVAVNLGKIYGTDTRAAEQAHRAVDRVIRTTRFNKISNLVTDIAAYDIYDLTGKQRALFDMQPYYVFRFETSIMYSADNLCDDTEITQTATVNLSSGTGGSATSSLGGEGGSPFTVDKNSNEAFYGIAETGYRFLNWLINGVSNLTNPLALIINKNYTIQAIFELLVSYIQDVIGTAPIDNVFEDQTTNDNDLIIKNTQVGTGDGISTRIISQNTVTLAEGEDFEINIKFSLKGSGNDFETYINLENNIVFQPKSSLVGGNPALLVRNTSEVLESVTSGSSLLRDGTVYDITCKKEGFNLTLTINGVDYTNTMALPSKASSSKVAIGSNQAGTSSTIFNGIYMEACFNNKLEYFFQEGNGATVYDRLTGANHGDITGAVLTSFWSNVSNNALSALVRYGFELYESDSVPDQFIRVIRSDTGYITPTISGYTKLAEIPINVIGNTGNLYDGLKISGLETNADYDSLIALETGAKYEVTKTANYVSNIKVITYP